MLTDNTPGANRRREHATESYQVPVFKCRSLPGPPVCAGVCHRRPAFDARLGHELRGADPLRDASLHCIRALRHSRGLARGQMESRGHDGRVVVLALSFLNFSKLFKSKYLLAISSCEFLNVTPLLISLNLVKASILTISFGVSL